MYQQTWSGMLRGGWLAALFGLALTGWGKQLPSYHYGEAWWHEYTSDANALLLLHFGPPQVTPRATLVEAIKVKQKEDNLGEEALTDGGGGAGAGALPTMKVEDLKLPPVDDRDVPPDTALDYSDQRQRVKLPPGCRVVPAGRFGAGLATDGTGLVRAMLPQGPRCLETWFRVAAYPARLACLLSLANDESRVLLRPDGHLEFRLKQPHGIPASGDRTKPLSPATLERLLARPAEIVSPDPVPLNEWVHVVVYNQSHPTPGGGEPFDARLKVNGFDVAWYLSERYNQYQDYLGRGPTLLVIGNNAEGKEGFAGVLDEVRASSTERQHYERPPLPWRDAKLERPLQFNRPWFRENGTVFHASLDRGRKLDFGPAPAADIAIDVPEAQLAGLLVPGIRGQGWVLDPAIGFPKVPLAGLNLREGALEFWLHPVNWDDMTGYWHHSPPPHLYLTIAQVCGKDPKSGQVQPVMTLSLPRGWNLERQRIPLDPGHWIHAMAVWGPGQRTWYLDGKPYGGFWQAAPEVIARSEPAYVEFGIPDQVTVLNQEAPRLEIDEVVGYGWALRADEVQQAYRRWQGKLEPISLYDANFTFKYSLQRLEFTLTPLLPKGVEAAAATVTLAEAAAGGKAVRGPVTATLAQGAFRMLLNDHDELPLGAYRFAFVARDAAGKTVLEGTRDWNYQQEPWWDCRAGILEHTPSPWTPIKVTGKTLETRMTRYVLAPDGLPAGIHADGVNLLAGPWSFQEDGVPLAGQLADLGASRDVEATWRATFKGRTCDIGMTCHLEFDGMIRYELTLQPKGKLAPLSLLVPLRAAGAKRLLYYPMGDRGVHTATIGAADGVVLESRVPQAPYATWQAYVKQRQQDPKLKWEDYWEPIKRNTRAYGFFGHLDINDLNRGLWWFCDNAAGWQQSPTKSAIEVVKQGDVVTLRLNLIAEPVEYQEQRPITFGILPHPARPLPTAYRRFERAPAPDDPKAVTIFDAFRPWPMDPKAGSMCLFPAADPKKPAAGPSWDYAASCIPDMKANQPNGYRTMYLSKAWFSCRAGWYDGWEWRSGDSSAVALTPRFVNYLCWEMNEWIGRGIWEAVYLDECYEHPARNLEAGMSVRLPDGSEQPGVTNFQFRELMKRWYGLFVAHGHRPVLISHNTYSFQYPGEVFCVAYLDGENAPIVSLDGRDWIGSTSRERFEVLQNARLWGITPFYMPFIAEGGFADKEKSKFPRWQWRMARQAQSQFAHYEVATVYEGQGSQVYKAYWKDVLGWGAGDPVVTFHPYWDNSQYVQVDDQGGETLVSFYRQPSKVLLIASNRRTAAATLKIGLKSAELGLPPDWKVKELDSSFDGPEGDDYTGGQDVKKETQALLEKKGNVLGGDEEGDLAAEQALVGEAEVKARERATWVPKREADVLILPVRPRDFRLIAIE